jgi:hypothetical protein
MIYNISQILIEAELASEKNSIHVPYRKLEEEWSNFAKPQYFPPGFIIKDPRNLKKEQILSFLHHVKNRQDLYGAEDAFRFSHYLTKNSRVSACYSEQLRSRPPTMEATPSDNPIMPLVHSPDKPTGVSRLAEETRLESSQDVTNIGSLETIGNEIQAPDNLYHPGLAGDTPTHRNMTGSDGSSSYTPIGMNPIGKETLGNKPIGSKPIGSKPIGNNPIHTKPHCRPTLDDTHIGSQPLVLISQGHRDMLLPLGVGVGAPINGPNDGPPQYAIPRSFIHTHASMLQSNVSQSDDADMYLGAGNVADSQQLDTGIDELSRVLKIGTVPIDPVLIANCDNDIGRVKGKSHFSYALERIEIHNVTEAARKPRTRRMADDLALIEAEQLVARPSRRRSKRIG